MRIDAAKLPLYSLGCLEDTFTALAQLTTQLTDTLFHRISHEDIPVSEPV